MKTRFTKHCALSKKVYRKMIRLLTHNDTKVLTYEITGKVTLAEEKEWIRQFETYLHPDEKIRILLIFGEHARWSLKAGVEDIKWLFANYRHIEKIALVSDSLWWKWYIKLDIFAKLFGTKERYFTSEQSAEALAWASQV